MIIRATAVAGAPAVSTQFAASHHIACGTHHHVRSSGGVVRSRPHHDIRPYSRSKSNFQQGHNLLRAWPLVRTPHMTTLVVPAVEMILVNAAPGAATPTATFIFTLFTHRSPSKNRTPVYCLQDSCSTIELTGRGERRDLHSLTAESQSAGALYCLRPQLSTKVTILVLHVQSVLCCLYTSRDRTCVRSA